MKGENVVSDRKEEVRKKTSGVFSSILMLLSSSFI
jgi:hypothetical protein